MKAPREVGPCAKCQPLITALRQIVDYVPRSAEEVDDHAYTLKHIALVALDRVKEG